MVAWTKLAVPSQTRRPVRPGPESPRMSCMPIDDVQASNLGLAKSITEAVRSMSSRKHPVTMYTDAIGSDLIQKEVELNSSSMSTG